LIQRLRTNHLHDSCLARWILFILSFSLSVSQAQQLQDLKAIDNKLLSLSDGTKDYSVGKPLITFEVNQKEYNSEKPSPFQIEFKSELQPTRGISGTILFKNTSKDTLSLSNVVPFGRVGNEVYLTGLGNHRLSRTHLFLPGRMPVNVIVPDNAWELGYTAIKVNEQLNLFGFVRRDLSMLVQATRKRFETVVAPGGSVVYNFYADLYKGEWQVGLREVFQKRYLYDAKDFDDSLFKRSDLAWIKKAYVMHLMMAWDKNFYDGNAGSFNLTDFIKNGKALYGGDDVVCVWPTWPTLGVDQRNQFDLYRDLPGGLQGLRALADESRKQGSKFFIAYNPWDESTRSEGHLKGLADLIKGTSADGVVLDTKGESSRELQDAADQVKPGVIMYSEGMAVPKDMQGIISGRVHNALYYPPMLNLNKFIRPDFAIFRVAEVYKEPIQREYAVAFFNGYGTEINQFAPGHPEWEEAQYKYLGRTTRILRENTSLFTSDYTPLIPTLRDSVWVNAWSSKDKTIYTIFSLKPEGFNGSLFEMNSTKSESRWIDLWKHEEVQVKKLGEKLYVIVNIDGFDSRDLGTNNEGNVSSIARFTPELKVKIAGDRLSGQCKPGSTIKVWKGNPAYDKEPVIVQAGNQFELSLSKTFARYEGKLVAQAFRDDELMDEQILFLKPGTPRLVSEIKKTPVAGKLPAEMVLIPAGKLTVHFTQGDEFIPYPKDHEGETISMNAFAIDKYPVTNTAFKRFLDASHYKPADTANFLKHWVNDQIPKGQENFPVTFVSYEDAKAYAVWAGKRLPTELEWQYAAQTPAGNEWPWKQTKPVTREETYVTETLTVKNLKGIDPQHCNLGDGELYAVGKYKKGVNPFGLYDLVGSVWQMTNDVYESGSYRYILIKGGSYFKPSSSWWYVQGGPRELHYRQFLLRVSQGFERNATVGFRCVSDLK
jgi:formylglycine-generating enzyme required for sulfatase activity